MTRKITIAAALAAAVLLAALIWLSLRDDPMLSETSTPLEGVDGGDAALMEEAQSPVQPQETPAADGEPSADSGAPESDTGPYKFERWEDAANHYAELVGLEYDALIAAGVDPDKAGSQAFHDVQENIFIGREDPALAAALEQYLPYSDSVPMEERTEKRMPLKEYGPRPFLVRAGRLPLLALKAGSLSLPNGERYYFDEDEEVVVIWQTRHVPADTEEGRQMLAQMEKDYAELETKLTHDPGNTEALEAIAALQTWMVDMRTPQLKNRWKEVRIGLSPEEVKRRLRERSQLRGPRPKPKPEDLQPSSPDLRLTVLQLGVIDE
ncbi:MAG: hypothetical protein OXT69_06790 [Candidatus Poribacteria bacterium]|nr:hypothetical protein [Candidatus Poribacteria bacterium]